MEDCLYLRHKEIMFHLLERGKIVASSESLYTILGYLEGFPRLIDGSVQSVAGVEVVFELHSDKRKCQVLGTVVKGLDGRETVKWVELDRLTRGLPSTRRIINS